MATRKKKRNAKNKTQQDRNIFSQMLCQTTVWVQKTLITNKCKKSFFINCKDTLLHVSTLMGHLQGKTFRCHYTRLHYTVERECAVDCALCRFWRRELFVVSACIAIRQYKPRPAMTQMKMTQRGRIM
jgi:hypothetical protein